MPDVVLTQPGVWAARVVHGSSPPVAVVFNVLAGGQLKELSQARVVTAGWEVSWSKPLQALALNPTEVDRLSAKLPKISATEGFDEPTNQQVLEPAIRLSLAAVRALFRSKQLAEAWSTYNTLNAPAAYVALHPGQTPEAAGKRAGVPVPQKEMPGKDGERRARLKLLRTQIDQLIKQNGSPWKAEEFPRS